MRRIAFAAADSLDAVEPVKRRETADREPVQDLLWVRTQRLQALVAGCLHLIYGVTTLAFFYVVFSNLVQAG